MDDVIKLLPNAKELRTLRLFVSTDETRFHLSVLWSYSSDGGATFVGTDGHTEVVRRSGTHRTMSMHEIVKMTPYVVGTDENGLSFKITTETTPPRWDSVMRIPGAGKLALHYGFNPDYMARIGDVERSAGCRAADDFEPSPGMAVKDQKRKKVDLKNGTFATWTIPSDPLDGWYWKLETGAALWEGIVMPRRV